jgi:hypothetical protein
MAPLNYSILRSLLYHAYIPFPDRTLGWITDWVETYPQLPIKWITLFEKISQTKSRLKKRSDIVEETISLPDGRVWSLCISADIMLLFQLLMVEEGKDYLGYLNCEEILATESRSENQQGQKSVSQFSQQHHDKLFLLCPFDQKVTSMLQILEDRSHSFLEGAQDSDLLFQCQQFLPNLAVQHPALFLRYQSIIKCFLTKPPQSKFPNKMISNGNDAKLHKSKKQDGDESSAATESVVQSLPPILPVAIPPKDQKNSTATTKKLLFTATGADLNQNLWEALLDAYHRCDPLILYLHATTRHYRMDRVLEVLNEYAERRIVSSLNLVFILHDVM